MVTSWVRLEVLSWKCIGQSRQFWTFLVKFVDAGTAEELLTATLRELDSVVTIVKTWLSVPGRTDVAKGFSSLDCECEDMSKTWSWAVILHKYIRLTHHQFYSVNCCFIESSLSLSGLISKMCTRLFLSRPALTVQVQCCRFTYDTGQHHKTMSCDGEPRAATSTFTQLLSSVTESDIPARHPEELKAY